MRRRRGSVEAPKKGMGLSKNDMAALAVAALILVAGFGYFAVTYKSGGSSGGGYVGVTLAVQITYGADNVTPTYFPSNFTLGLGQHITVDVTNLTNETYGIAFAQPSGKAPVDTGPITTQATASVSFVGSVTGNYTISEPSADCASNCANTADLVGWYLVTSAS